jgi:hypothetical protein
MGRAWTLPCIVARCRFNVYGRTKLLPHSGHSSFLPKIAPPYWIDRLFLLPLPDCSDFLRLGRLGLCFAFVPNTVFKSSKTGLDSKRRGLEPVPLILSDFNTNLQTKLNSPQTDGHANENNSPIRRANKSVAVAIKMCDVHSSTFNSRLRIN